MYKIKEKPEDFIVKEISNIKTSEGQYNYFKLKKTELNTIDACKKIAFALRINLNDIGFAGTKDRHAVTEQVISIKNVNKDKVTKLNIDNIKLNFIGSCNKPISLGDLEGNEFIITIRAVEKEPDKINFTVNYFDDQRFSTDNVKIGKFILKKDFKSAAELIAKTNKFVDDYLKEKPTDFVGAIRQLPKKIASFYINSFQSYLWNEVVSKYIRKEFKDVKECGYSQGKLAFPKELDKPNNISIPLIGFGTEFEDKELESAYTKLLEKENLTQRDFIIREIPNLSSEGSERDVFSEVKDLTIDCKDSVCKLNFKLNKGSYATIVIKNMFC